jgi:NADH:ubiquinone oxidoreductase subunit 4 (subunit M)
VTDISWNVKIALGLVVIAIFWLGIYPQTLLNETTGTTDALLKRFETLRFSLQNYLQ